jgi:hypothetical protein
MQRLLIFLLLLIGPFAVCKAQSGKGDTTFSMTVHYYSCATGIDTGLTYSESGSIKRMRKTGYWKGTWSNGTTAYSAHYKQRLRLKRTDVRKVRNGNAINVQRLRFRWWTVPVDSLVEYFPNGKVSVVVHFNRRGKIRDKTVNAYDFQGRLRLSLDTKTGRHKLYCEHGIVVDSTGMLKTKYAADEGEEDPVPEHYETCEATCFENIFICGWFTTERRIDAPRAKF